MSTSRPASSRGHAYSMPPPPSPHLDESAKLKSQKTILRVHLVGESKHKILSLRKCSRAKSLFSKLATTWAVKEQDVKKLCFTFNWKAHRDSERTLELEDEFDIIGADYLFELIKDAPCWSEPSGSVTGRCIIDVKMFVSRTQAEETFWPRSPEL